MSVKMSETSIDIIVNLVIICLIWIAYYICYSIYNKKYSSKYNNKYSSKYNNFDSLVVVQQNCYSFTAKHIYLIKLHYGKSRKKFHFLSNIVLDLIDVNDKIFMTIKVPPHLLLESQKENFREDQKESKAKLLAFVLQTKISLSEVRAVRINHDCRNGDIFVYEIKIINLISQQVVSSKAYNYVCSLSPDTDPRAQVYVCNFVGINMTDIKPSPYLNFPEVLLFFFFGFDLILFHTQYNINSMDRLFFAKKYDNYTTMAMTGLMSGGFAITVVIIFLVFYYGMIKRNYSQLRGIGWVWFLRLSFIFFIVSMSVAFGLMSAIKSVGLDSTAEPTPEPTRGPKIWGHTTYKWFATIIGSLVYSMALFTIILMTQYCGFCRDTEEYDLKLEHEPSFRSQKTIEEEEEDNKKTINSSQSQSLTVLHSKVDDNNQKTNQNNKSSSKSPTNKGTVLQSEDNT